MVPDASQPTSAAPPTAPKGLSRVEALAYELKVKDVMTSPVVTIAPSRSIADLSELLRAHGITGVPVVSGESLLGIVSVADLITALGRGDLAAPVSSYMTAALITVNENDAMVRAVEVFTKTRVGRLPVLDAAGRLVGMVTKGDLTQGTLRALQVAQDDEEVRRYRASHLFEDIVSDRTSLLLRYRVRHRDFVTGGMASANVRHALLRLGASLETARRCAIAVYEAEMNLVIHTTNGGLIRVEIHPHLIFIEALDDGPGIADTAQAMQPGYTTTPPEIRAMGFGAGFGLVNIQRCVDKMWLKSTPGEGTRLEMWIYLQPGAERREVETLLDRLSLVTPVGSEPPGPKEAA